MILPYHQVRDADRGYATTVLVSFVAHYGRNPDGRETLSDWWSLPLPIHQRLGVLGGVAATYPEHTPKVLRALQDAAMLAAESALPAWTAAYPNDLTLTIAIDAARAYLEAPTRPGRANVRRHGRAVRIAALTPATNAMQSNLLTVYNALLVVSPTDDDELEFTRREVTLLLHCARDAGLDLTTAAARLDALVAELSGATP